MRGAAIGVLAVFIGCSGGSSSSDAGPARDAGGGSDGADATASTPSDGGIDGSNDAPIADATGGDTGVDATADGPSGPLPDYASGSRLRAMVYRTADGTKLWHGWYDATLDTPCTFTEGAAEDGATRCLPVGVGAYYIDSACTTPVTVVQSGCSVPTHVSEAVATTPCRSAAYTVGPAVDAGAGLFYAMGSTCAPTSVPGTVHSLTHLAATALVGATRVVDPRTTSLGAAYWKADDGALQSLGAVDLARSAACAPLSGAYASACAPSDLVYVAIPLFSDMACTLRAARKFDLGCLGAGAQTVEVQTYDSCGNEAIALDSLGAALTASYTLPSGGSCTEAGAPVHFTDYALGAAIPASSLPVVKTVDLGTGRITTRYVSAGTGEKISVSTWVDSQLGAACAVLNTSAGLRCLPGDYHQEAYSDMSCSLPVVWANQPAGCSAPSPPAFAQWTSGTGTCADPELLRLMQVGAPTSVMTGGVYAKSPTCGATGIDPTHLAMFSATEVDLTTLPAITDVTE
ncbi:MAG: hypothetical protein ACRENE_35165 [Polyangiaceae bacterium]